MQLFCLCKNSNCGELKQLVARMGCEECVLDVNGFFGGGSGERFDHFLIDISITLSL